MSSVFTSVSAQPLRVLYASEPYVKSIFLAGPTPRDAVTPSWRPEALKLLAQVGFTGQVIVPEPRDGRWSEEIIAGQIAWEWEGLATATVVAFWVPRDLATMPAFTTNIEFGMLCSTGKALIGAPTEAPGNGYLRALAARYSMTVEDSLEALIRSAVAWCDRPFPRAAMKHPYNS